MALRQLLAMERLPAESQQIDRVLSAFSKHYVHCNPRLLDKDTAYFLTFSLLLLHTDLFHRSVRARMSKAEYVALTESSHVGRVILEYLYDNVSLVEFFHPFSKEDVKGAVSAQERDALYKLILTGGIVDLQQQKLTLEMHAKFPSKYTSGTFAREKMHKAVLNAWLAEMHTTSRTALRWRNSAGRKSYPSPLVLRILMSGVVRRFETDAHGKSADRGREWGLVLTGSCLLWFRDPMALPHVSNATESVTLKPDEIVPLADALCLMDGDSNTMRLRLWVSQHGQDLEPIGTSVLDWLDQINYVASLSNCGLVWDDALMLCGGEVWCATKMHRVLTGPLQTAALVPNGGQRSTYLSCLFSAGLALSQSVLQVSRYLHQQQDRLRELAKALDDHERFIQHLRILTPLQKSTRESIEHATHEALGQWRGVQLEQTFLACRLDFLATQRQVLQAQLHQHGCEIHMPG